MMCRPWHVHARKVPLFMAVCGSRQHIQQCSAQRWLLVVILIQELEIGCVTVAGSICRFGFADCCQQLASSPPPNMNALGSLFQPSILMQSRTAGPSFAASCGRLGVRLTYFTHSSGCVKAGDQTKSWCDFCALSLQEWVSVV